MLRFFLPLACSVLFYALFFAPVSRRVHNSNIFHKPYIDWLQYISYHASRHSVTACISFWSYASIFCFVVLGNLVIVKHWKRSDWELYYCTDIWFGIFLGAIFFANDKMIHLFIRSTSFHFFFIFLFSIANTITKATTTRC